MDDRRMQLANALMQPSQQRWMPQQQNTFMQQMGRLNNNPLQPMSMGFKPYYPSMDNPQQVMPQQGFSGMKANQGQSTTSPYNYYQNQ